MTGDRVGQWILDSEIGRGPAGIVYRAASVTVLGEVAAVKIFTHPLTRAADFLSRFPAGVLGLKRLAHPNIATYHDAGTHAGQAWVASELVEGEDLETILRRHGRSGLDPAADVLRVAVQMVRALKHGHNRSILHRALKPAAVRVTPAGVVKLTDFGLAKLLPFAPTDLPADPWGTVGTMAPEQFTGKPVTKKSDLYSLGGVLYALTTGRPMMSAPTIAEFLHKHCYTLPDRPAAFAPGVPPDLDDLICTLIAKDPARRPAAAQVVLDELAQLRGKLERKGISVAWPADPGDGSGPMPALVAAAPRPERPPPEPFWSRTVVLLPLFLLVVGLTVWLTVRPRPSADELFNHASALAASPDPADWDRALTEGLEPLADRFADIHTAEATAIRNQLRDQQELRRALEAAARPATTPAELVYRWGLKRLEAGDVNGARRVWADLVRAFGHRPADTRWVQLAERGIAATANLPPRSPDLTGILSGATDLAIVQAALRELFRDDRAALAPVPVGP